MATDQLKRLGAALAGRYAVERELGRGGMAEVYLADDLKHRRKVAIKVLRPELAAALGADRFSREVRIAAALNHPHILPLHDSGEAGGLLFYVMPFVRGESLRQRLAREDQLPVDEAVAIARQVAGALEHAHARGLIHRDIKPENILLHEGEAMVTDFGIALAAGSESESRLTGTGLALGTPAYMSPEQAAGERTLDARTDVYSLGCVLFEMLAGQPPHAGPTAQAIIFRRVTEPEPLVRRLRPTVPVPLERALVKALARDPDNRFPSAAAFAAALAAPAAGPARTPSIAVLPFTNLSPDPENEYFADGMTEDVITQLSKIRSLKVISRSSVIAFKKREQSPREIGAALDVATLLEGSVRRAGTRVRIVAQLIDVETDRHLWGETYDRDLTDIFAIQTDVALQIAAALETELSPDERHRLRKEPTRDVEAYQLYLLGRQCFHQWTRPAVEKGLRYLEQSVARDPDFALAHATMGYVYIDVGVGVVTGLRPEDAFQRARAATARALELDPGLAEAHAVLGYLKCACDYDWTGAEIELKRAIELNPNSGYAHDMYGLMLAAVERYDEAMAMQRRAHELDPMHHRIDILTTLLRAGRHEEALAGLRRLVEIEPGFALAHLTLGWAQLLSGSPDEGIASHERAVSLAPDNSMYLAQLGEALAQAGRVPEARGVLRRLEELSATQHVSPYHLAYVYTGLGEYDRALDCLERAWEERTGAMFGVKGSFLFRPLRQHARFQALLRKMNLA